MKELIIKLKNNYVVDLNRTEINKFERAIIIKDLMQEYNLSIRSFAEKYGFNKSTVEDWLLWNKITQEEYTAKLKEGYTESEVYRLLRNNKTKPIKDFCSIDLVIESTVHKLTQEHEVSKYTSEKIKRLERAIQDFRVKHNL